MFGLNNALKLFDNFVSCLFFNYILSNNLSVINFEMTDGPILSTTTTELPRIRASKVHCIRCSTLLATFLKQEIFLPIFQSTFLIQVVAMSVLLYGCTTWTKNNAWQEI